MTEIAYIRRYRPGEAAALFNVYYSSIHLVASRDYTAEQLQAWAPRDLEPALWENRMRAINPFVAELERELVGYADVQASGYIDHFFVSGRYPRRGIGTLLMRHLLAEATSHGITELTSDVSRTAQPFFQRFGFAVVEERYPTTRGVVVPNSHMRLRLE